MDIFREGIVDPQVSSCGGKQQSKFSANSFKCRVVMHNNSFQFISACQKGVQIWTQPFCTRISQRATFILNPSVLFLSPKMLVLNP